jgi:hypothetical protein
MPADLRYPVGAFSAPAHLDSTDRVAAIRMLAEAPALFRLAVAGLDDAQLDTPYRPGGWTCRQVVHHVADSHMNAYLRTKFALAEDNPTIKPYAEAVWAELADARGAPVALSLDLIEALHSRWVICLRAIGEDGWKRTLLHPDRGPMTLDDLVALYEWHSRHHLGHITDLRARMGW